MLTTYTIITPGSGSVIATIGALVMFGAYLAESYVVYGMARRQKHSQRKPR